MKRSERALATDSMGKKSTWTSRLYGGAERLFGLRDEQGRPTQFGRRAAAWGDPLPKTFSAARRMAEKGRMLLAKYRSARAS